MLSAGRNIQSVSDSLVKVNLSQLFSSLKNPKPEIQNKIHQLRIIRDLDKKKYAYLKKQLPYIVCGQFNPPFRRLENFTYTEHFIVDLDHLFEKGIDINALRNILKKDKRLVLMFVSPSEDGLKLLFNLSERCTDAGIYSVFYKKFIQSFSLQYGLQQVTDSVTCDVSRACFISIDPDVYYNPEAEKVVVQDFISLEDTITLFDENSKIKKEKPKTDTENKLPKDPDSETLAQIKNLLGMQLRAEKEKKNVFVPEELNTITDNLKSFIEEKGIFVYEIKNIQYGKKIKCRLGAKKAEVNLFYGKKGFSIVKTPASGTSEELNDIVASAVEIYLEENVL